MVRFTFKAIGFAAAVVIGVLLFIAGLVDLADGAKEDPSNGFGMGFGILEMVAAIPVFLLIWWVSVKIVNSIFDYDYSRPSHQFRGPRPGSARHGEVTWARITREAEAMDDE